MNAPAQNLKANVAHYSAGTIAFTATRNGSVHTARFTNDMEGAAEWRARWEADGWLVEIAPVSAEPAARPFSRFGSTNTHYAHAEGLGAAGLGLSKGSRL
jgi:hypothetical protein